jgi:hypothetical protein
MGDRLPRLSAVPSRIFVSVDESTGRSTLSFAPPGVSDPILREDDRTGELAMDEARMVAAEYPGCTIEGPHFHDSSRRKPRPRRPPPRNQ